MSCSLVWLEPKAVDLQEFYKNEYRELYRPVMGQVIDAEESFQIYGSLIVERVERVQPYLNQSMRVLEIGCGSGWFLDALEPFVGERVGVEFDESHAAYARKRLGIEVYTNAMTATDHPKHAFDMIFASHVLEHVEDPLKFIQEMLEYLAPHGKIYIEVPNLDDALLSAYEVQEFADFYYVEPHLYYWTPKTFRAMMDRAGVGGSFRWSNGTAWQTIFTG